MWGCLGDWFSRCLLRRIRHQKFELFKFDSGLLRQPEPIVEVKLSFHIQSEAEEGIDQVDKASEELARLDEALDHPYLGLIEESFPDLFELLLDLNLSRFLIAMYSA